MSTSPTRTSPGHEEPDARRPIVGEGPWRLALVASGLAVLLVLVLLTRHLTFAADDWSFLTARVGVSADTYLKPHNEHLSAVPILIYQVLRAVFGATSYLPYQLVQLATHLAVCGLVWLLAARRTGPWVALAPAAIVGLLGPASDDLLWAFQVGFCLAMGLGLGAWALLERGGRRADALACVLLVLSLASASVGVGLVAGAVVLVLLGPARWRRLWVVAIPTGLYLLWYLGYGSPAPSADWSRVPGYMADSLSAALASIAGLAQPRSSDVVGLVDPTYGRPLAVACVAGLGWLYVRRGHLPALACAAVAGALVLWFFIALEVLGDFRNPQSTRYQYLGVVLLLVAGAAVAPGWRPSRPARVVGVVALAWVLVANVLVLHDAAVKTRAAAVVTRSLLAALDVSRPVVAPSHVSVDFFTLPMSAGGYFSLEQAHGTVAFSEAELAAAPEPARLRADVVLADAERLSARGAGGAKRATGCVPVGGVLTAGPGTYVVRSPGASPTLRAARYADVARAPIAAPAGTSVLTIPRDASTRPWRLALAGPADATICREAGA